MAEKKILKKKQIEEEEEQQVKLKQIDDDSHEQKYEFVAVPPDGGFGWVIVIAAMVFIYFSTYKS